MAKKLDDLMIIKKGLEDEINQLSRKRLIISTDLERTIKEITKQKSDSIKEIAAMKQVAEEEIELKQAGLLKREKELNARERDIKKNESETKAIELEHNKLQEEKKALAKDKKDISNLKSELNEKIRVAELREEKAKKIIEG